MATIDRKSLVSKATLKRRSLPIKPANGGIPANDPIPTTSTKAAQGFLLAKFYVSTKVKDNLNLIEVFAYEDIFNVPRNTLK